VKSVKVYRVLHLIMPIPEFFQGLDPRDPETYRPVYLGEYDLTGNLLDHDSPFLYWMLPIVRRDPTRPTWISNYAARHADDPNWEYHFVASDDQALIPASMRPAQKQKEEQPRELK
jgi:hypothetical protein